MGYLIDVISIAFDVMYWLIIVRVLLSWVRHDPRRPAFKFIYEITEVVLGPIRRLMPRGGMGIDFSPIIAILLLKVLQPYIINFLYNILT